MHHECNLKIHAYEKKGNLSHGKVLGVINRPQIMNLSAITKVMQHQHPIKASALIKIRYLIWYN